MKNLIILFGIGLLTISCDPVQLVFINNYTESEMQVKVNLINDYSMSDIIEVQYTDTIIKNPKELIRYRFDKKTQVILIDKNTYMVEIPSKSTSLMGPLRIGFPIRKFYINGKLGNDSILFYVKNVEMKKQIKRGKLQKVNWTYFIYNYRN